MEKYRWTHEGVQLWHSGDYYEVAEVDLRVGIIEDALADANEDNSALETTVADLQDKVQKLKSVLEDIEGFARAAVR